MSEMMERVAKAIFAKRRTNFPLAQWEELCTSERAYYWDLALAAMWAMHEPTDDMKALEGVHWDYNCHVCGGLKEGWQTMMGFALGTPPPEKATSEVMR